MFVISVMAYPPGDDPAIPASIHLTRAEAKAAAAKWRQQLPPGWLLSTKLMELDVPRSRGWPDPDGIVAKFNAEAARKLDARFAAGLSSLPPS